MYIWEAQIEKNKRRHEEAELASAWSRRYTLPMIVRICRAAKEAGIAVRLADNEPATLSIEFMPTNGVPGDYSGTDMPGREAETMQAFTAHVMEELRQAKACAIAIVDAWIAPSGMITLALVA